jgi:1-deoxy-D-xylulose-5-phosphate reductoisomerase
VIAVSILGATGSVGKSTADLLLREPDRYRTVTLVGGRNAGALAEMAVALRAETAVLADPAGLQELRERLSGSGIVAEAGEGAVLEAAGRPADVTVSAIVGAAGLAPTLAALGGSRTVALANKECLVCAGTLFMEEARRRGVRILPVDSEHNAIFQVFEAANAASVTEIILTASGGPFRTLPAGEFAAVTPEQALRHPNWSMGAKITIDSATMMNKGLELIEASHLFPVKRSSLSVLIHPQSVVHGLVRYADGSLLAQLGSPDMRTPIAYCLAWPERRPSPVVPLDLALLGTLTFEAPDRARFPCLKLAEAALEAGGGATNVLNAANEVAVEAFLQRRIGYLDIAAVVQQCLEDAGARGILAEPATLEEALGLDAEARRFASASIARLEAPPARAQDHMKRPGAASPAAGV